MEKIGKLQKQAAQANKYWNTFYQDKDVVTNEPSPFAQYCADNFILSGASILDIGCGNGRDSNYFAALRCQVLAVDPFSDPNILAPYLKTGIDKLVDIKCDYIYARFFIHAIPLKSEIKFWEYVKRNCKKFAVECRSDKSAFDGDHYRRFINIDELKERLDSFGFDYKIEENTGFAKFEDQDPVIIRVLGTT